MAGRGNGKGRKKIKMEKMEKRSNLQVTFSKRRNGVFKKAYELSILTGAEVALIVFSPGGKVHSFGHPTIEAVTKRFLTGSTWPLTPKEQQIQNERNRNIYETNAILDNVKNLLEFERKRAEALNKLLAPSQGSEQNIPQLKHSLEALRNFSAEVQREINARVLGGRQSYTVPEPFPYASGCFLSPVPSGTNSYPFGGWPINVGLSSIHGGGPFVPQPISFGGGAFIVGPSSSFVGGGFPTAVEPGSSRDGNGGGSSNASLLQWDVSNLPNGFNGAH